MQSRNSVNEVPLRCIFLLVVSFSSNYCENVSSNAAIEIKHTYFLSSLDLNFYTLPCENTVNSKKFWVVQKCNMCALFHWCSCHFKGL